MDAQTRIGIEVEILGYAEAKQKMQDLINRIQEVGRTKAKIEFADRIKELDANIRNLRSTVGKLRQDIIDGVDPKGARDKIKQANVEIANSRNEMNRLKAAMKEIPVKSWGEQFRTTMRSVASSVKQAGSAMQTFGRTLQSITGIGGRITSGLLMGLGYRALNTITSGLGGALERSDTFKTYGRVIQAIMPKLTAEETAAGIERLNDAVLGLPTGLDEIVNSQKMFTLSTGDYQKAVDLAIASNNAFLASGASAEAKNTGERMLNTFLATGKLTAKQWMSLQRTMPSALRAVATELGYADDAFGTFFNDLKTGKITVDDFTKSFVEVGTKGTISKAVEPMKETYGAILANWQNAVKRLGQNVLDTLSDTLEKSTGKNIYQWLLKVKDGIDAVSQAIQNWIKRNPQKIKEFFESFASIDWLGLLRGIGQGLQWVAEFIRGAFDLIGKLFGGGGAEAVGRFLIKGNVYGKIITILGGFIKGLSPMIGAVASLIKHLPIGKFLKVVMSPLTKLFSKLGTLGKGARAAEKGAEAAGSVMKSVGGWQSVAKMGIAVAAIPAIAGAIKLLASALKDLDGIELTWFTKGSKTGVLKALGMMATLLGSFAGIATGLGALFSIPGLGWIATYALGKGLIIITAISGAIRAVTGMMNDLSNTDYPSVDKVEELKDRLKDLAPLLTELVDILNEDGKNAYEVSEEAKTAKAYADVVSAVKSIGAQMKALADMSITTEQIKAAKQTIKDIGNALDELSDVITEVFGEKIYNTEGTIETNISGNGFVGTRFDTEAVRAMADTTQAFADIFGGFEQIVSNLTELNKMINDLVENGALATAEDGGIDFSVIHARLDSIATELTKLLTGGDSPFVRLKTVAKYFENANLSEITTGVKEIGKTVTELLTLEQSLGDLVGDGAEKISAPGGTETPLIKVKNDLITLADNLSEIKNSFRNLDGLEAFKTNAENAKAGVSAINTLVTTLGTIKTQFDAGATEGVAAAIKTLITTLTEALVQAPIFFTQSELFHGAVDAFKASVDTLVGINGDGLAQIPGQLRAIGDALSRLTTTMSGIGQKWHDAIINGFNAPGVRDAISAALMVIAFSINTSGFYSAGYSAGMSFASGVRAAAGSGGLSSGLSSIFRARGGKIFKKRGTDTVPAMLTPGEYVMRKKAVSTFGQDFMRRVNSLDIKGAMASLMMRGGSRVMRSYGSNITNNTVNKTNNAKVTQNIYSNNPNFAYRRANRWVGAL